MPRRPFRPAPTATGVVAAALAMAAGLVASPAAAAAPRQSPAQAADDHAGSGLTPVTATADTARRLAAVGQTLGTDVSSHQGNVDWAAAWRAGARFAYAKATEGVAYSNPYFSQQYNGSYGVGMVRGAYHFALPDRSGGATQATYFMAHGGGWSADGRTLPPALDIEYNPYGSTCYGLSQKQMVSWVHSFSTTVHQRTGRYPSIYTTADWWSTCTGGNRSVAGTNSLWVARYASSPGTLPAGWASWRIWQYAAAGPLPGDQDVFHGTVKQLRRYALGR